MITTATIECRACTIYRHRARYGHRARFTVAGSRGEPLGRHATLTVAQHALLPLTITTSLIGIAS